MGAGRNTQDLLRPQCRICALDTRTHIQHAKASHMAKPNISEMKGIDSFHSGKGHEYLLSNNLIYHGT